MTVVSRIYNLLQEGSEVTGQQIADIIQEAKPRAIVMKNLYERYKGTRDGVPILTRTLPIENISKINNKLANDYFSDIVHTKIGYFAGKPIVYKYPDVEDADKKLLQGFLKRASYADLDSETAKMAAIAGMAVRYLYIDLDGNAAVINVPPWECVFICDEIGISDAPYAIRYYPLERENKKFLKVEFMDDEKISYWVREGDLDSQGAFLLDPMEEANPIAHLMDGCPLICFPNNEELQGDCEKVLTLIDSYDRTISDMNSEIEQFRLAYMAFYGMVPTNETLDLARQTGAFGFPDGEKSRMEFVTKNINDGAIQNHLMQLDRNILYFAQSVRFSDESFGTASGISLRFKIFALETKCQICERKFTKSLQRMMKVLNGYYGRKGISYDPLEWTFTFVRNFPLHLGDEAQSLSLLTGLISKETALSLMSFIENPKEEIKKMKEEEEEYMRASQELAAAEAEQNVQEEPRPPSPETPIEVQSVEKPIST